MFNLSPFESHSEQMTMPPRRYLILPAIALLAIFIGYQAVFTWPADEAGTRQTAEADRSRSKIASGVVSTGSHRMHYTDCLELDRENLLLALRDLGSQFWTN